MRKVPLAVVAALSMLVGSATTFAASNSVNAASSATYTPSVKAMDSFFPSVKAMDSFFAESLDKAKDQLLGLGGNDSPRQSVNAVLEDGGDLEPSFAIGKKKPGPVDPLPTAGDTATCGEASTCSGFSTCQGTATVCANTCGSYPTCNGTASMCTNTCSTYPSCDVASGCTPTSAQWETCNGNGQPTQSCNSSCSTYPTCYSTCNGSGATCGSGQSTCQSFTCKGAPSCDGTTTCEGSSCGPTQKQSSCQGTPPSYCANTCSGFETCAGFSCTESDGKAAREPDFADPSLSMLMLGMGSILVVRRRKTESNA